MPQFQPGKTAEPNPVSVSPYPDFIAVPMICAP